MRLNDSVLRVRVAIMQPYFYPYIGYFQLILAADLFVIADNYQYTKQTWINRNRLILDKKVDFISIPVKSHNPQALISEIEISDRFLPMKILSRIRNNYSKSEGWDFFSPALSNVLLDKKDNLGEKVNASIEINMEILGIETKTLQLSKIPIESNLKGQDRVIAICEAVGASEYVNLPGGKTLYSAEAFDRKGLKLSFIEPDLIEYKQNMEGFTSHLSILDLAFSEGFTKLKSIHLPRFDVVKSTETSINAN